ncbi:MAG: NADH-quinone oxidoreductase subunit N [Deltaproteobacteria bacterium]|nr:NADH-quinone oxidoreductase subunit N [Deltaproteobacteria bacterium]
MISLPELTFVGILPALLLCAAGVVILVVGWFLRRGVLVVSCAVGIVGIAAALIANNPLRFANDSAFSNMLAVDAYSWFLNIVILIAAGLTILMSVRYLEDEGIAMYEYFVLVLFAAAGMMFMVGGDHILMIYIGLETLSISIYILAGGLPESVKSKEAAMKYLILGGFASGMFLYGAALLFGAAGTLSLTGLAKHFQAGQVGLLAKAGMGLILVGFCFKVSAVPFHMWTPDVYDGAPTPLTAFMSVGVKAAAFAAFVRVFFEALTQFQVDWTQILWALAVLTMILGNVAAVVQENIKRMLAYSSIAHAGYILIGMIAGGKAGISGVLYYLLAYTFTNLGAFGIVALVGRKGEARIMLKDYRGLGNSNPLLAVAMSIFMFSLAGIPPTAGFIGKFTIFSAALAQGYIWLVIIAVLTSIVSVFYYFRVIMKMYMETPETQPAALQLSPATAAALIISTAGVLYIGIFPTTYLGLALESVKPLF